MSAEESNNEQQLQGAPIQSSDSQLDAMKAKMEEMQKEADKLRELSEQQQQQQQQAQHVQHIPVGTEAPAASQIEASQIAQQNSQLQDNSQQLQQSQSQPQQQTQEQSGESSDDVDSRSVYVGSVDYGSSPEELQKHFQDCGSINRVTILMDKFTGHPKGFAYIEFADATSVSAALLLNDSLFRGRNLKVTAKRTNVPGMGTRGHRGGRGRGGFGRGSSGGFRGGRGYGRGGAFRGGFRGRGRFVPY